jgi:hypothetical protein
MKSLRALVSAVTAISTLSVSVPAQAAYVDANVGLVTRIFTYSTHGTGDIAISVQNPGVGCQHGYWLRMTDAGAKNIYAQILAYQLAEKPLRIGGYSDQRWTGSTGDYCRIDFVGNP